MSRTTAVFAMAIALCASAGHAQDYAQLVRSTEAPPNAIWLEDLDLTKWQQRRQRPRARQSLRGNPITMNGIVYPHGVGTLTINEFLIDLKGNAERFVALVGIDDEVRGRRGSVNFEIWLDDKLVASSGVIRSTDPPKLLVADLRGGRVLQLITDDGQDTSNDDNADWAGAMIIMREGVTTRPEPYVHPPEPEPVIALGNAPETRINGPRITGATPGRPFLFLIPATGEAPLTFRARNLLPGLALDSKTGIITGASRVQARGPSS